MKMDIGELAKRSGVHANTIRHYEDVGLISTADRVTGCFRTYGQEDVVALRFIKRARGLGFTLEDVEKLLKFSEENSQPCAEIREIALQQLEELDLKIDELSLIRNTLAEAVRNSDGILLLEDLMRDGSLDDFPLYLRFL